MARQYWLRTLVFRRCREFQSQGHETKRCNKTVSCRKEKTKIPPDGSVSRKPTDSARENCFTSLWLRSHIVRSDPILLTTHALGIYRWSLPAGTLSLLFQKFLHVCPCRVNKFFFFSVLLVILNLGSVEKPFVSLNEWQSCCGAVLARGSEKRTPFRTQPISTRFLSSVL